MNQIWIYHQSRGEFTYSRNDRIDRILDSHRGTYGGRVNRDDLFDALKIEQHPVSSFGADGTMVINIYRAYPLADSYAMDYEYAALIEYETDDELLLVQSFPALVHWMQKMVPMIDMALSTANYRALMR